MSLEPPATIAILGATPLGIEAALYARFLGYRVLVISREPPFAALRDRGAEYLGRPAEEHTSSLGRAALAAQDAAYSAPSGSWTSLGWIEAYLGLLLKSDLLADTLRDRTEIVALRAQLPGESLPPTADEQAGEKGDEAGAEVAEEFEEERLPGFELTLRDRHGVESKHQVDAVIAAEPAGVEILQALAPDERLLTLETAWDAAPYVVGLGQVRDLCAKLFGRADLDLYARMRT